MRKEYEVIKYNDEWSIYAKRSCCFVLFGTKKEMIKRCKILNEMEDYEA